MVQVHHDEGVANHIDPESCVAVREGICEALTGECIGQPLSRESHLLLGVDVVPLTEDNTDERDIASAHPPGVVAEPGMCGRSLRGNREVSRLTFTGLHREGEEP
jgi:hypothetical protein